MTLFLRAPYAFLPSTSLSVRLVAVSFSLLASAGGVASDELKEVNEKISQLAVETDKIADVAESVAREFRVLELEVLESFKNWRLPLEQVLTQGSELDPADQGWLVRIFITLCPRISDGDLNVISELRSKAPAVSAAYLGKFSQVAQFEAAEGYVLKLGERNVVVLFDNKGTSALLSQNDDRAAQHRFFKLVCESSLSAQLFRSQQPKNPNGTMGSWEGLFETTVHQTSVGPVQQSAFRVYATSYNFSLLTGTEENEAFNWTSYTVRRVVPPQSAAGSSEAVDSSK